MTTKALGTFGVYGEASQDEIEVLALADEYREQLCDLLWQRYKDLIDFRNDHFPALYEALVEWERVKAKIWIVEREIKEHHSDMRDRNAVTVPQRIDLTGLRKQRTDWHKRVKELREEWYGVQRLYSTAFASVADWKNVKSLERRRQIVDSIDWPQAVETAKANALKAIKVEKKQKARKAAQKRFDAVPWNFDAATLAEYAAIFQDADIRQRELGREFQNRGLHSAIRGEIVDATKEKIGKDGPGMRYEYHRSPQPKPWEKLTLQIVGGYRLGRDQISGLQIDPRYTNHKFSGDETIYIVRQQIGTRAHPRLVRYAVKLHREMPEDAVVQCWSLVVRASGKRVVIPVIRTESLAKPTGQGVVAYDLTWRRVGGGIQVCHFIGEHVNERLVLPDWLLDRRMGVAAAQMVCDNEANRLLTDIGHAPQTGGRQGVAALESYCASHPKNARAANVLHDLMRDMKIARRDQSKAVRCIEKIYETVSRRVCSRHSALIEDDIDLAKLKRYDTRDLLRFDPIPRKSREYLQAVSPGKLSALLKGYGLASAEALDDNAVVARETDLFGSWVASLHIKTGRKQSENNRRSQNRLQGEAVV